MKVLDEIETILWNLLYPMNGYELTDGITIGHIQEGNSDLRLPVFLFIQCDQENQNSLGIRVVYKKVEARKVITSSSPIKNLLLKRDSLENLKLTIYSQARIMYQTEIVPTLNKQKDATGQ